MDSSIHTHARTHIHMNEIRHVRPLHSGRILHIAMQKYPKLNLRFLSKMLHLDSSKNQQ